MRPHNPQLHCLWGAGDGGHKQPHFGADWDSFVVPNSSQSHMRIWDTPPPSFWGSFGAPNSSYSYQIWMWDPHTPQFGAVWGRLGAPNGSQPHWMRMWDPHTPILGQIGADLGLPTHPNPIRCGCGTHTPPFWSDWGSFGVPNGSQPHQMKTWDTNIPISGQFWGSQLILFISDVDVGPTHPYFGTDWGSFGVPNSSQPHWMRTLDASPPIWGQFWGSQRPPAPSDEDMGHKHPHFGAVWGSFGVPNGSQPHWMRTWDPHTPILGQIGAVLGLPTHPNPIG